MIIAANPAIDDDDYDRVFRTLLEQARAKQVKQARYYGHLITGDGIQTDPHKVKAILEMPAATDASGVRFIGMVVRLKFVVTHQTDTAENRCRVGIVERTYYSKCSRRSRRKSCLRRFDFLI